MSPGEDKSVTTRVLLTQTSQSDYDELCCLDILGLADSPQQDQKEVYAEFREQLVRDEAGWYGKLIRATIPPYQLTNRVVCAGCEA
mgnify:CR=1 FL=1